MSNPLADDRLIEPPSPDGLMPVSWWSWWPVAALVLAFAVLGFWWWRRKARPASGPDAPRAHAKALAALSCCPTDDLPGTATRLSLILRRYLAEVTGDPALYETHEELVARSNALGSLGEEVRRHTRELFDQLARIKYAPGRADDDPIALRDEAVRLLQALNREVAP